MTGFVSLAGAGPGDPDLVTLKTVDRLRRADLVLYDALVHPDVLSHAQGARFYVGKRAGRHSMSQETINALLVSKAREGLRVVRLKCGDPFVLGRGGEEALALRAAGIPHEVIPGVTSAVMAPATEGVPVTHRGLASSFVVVSGHDPAAFEMLGAIPEGVTVVVLMAFRRRRAVAERLLASGWAKNTGALITAGAGTKRARSWIGRLDELGEEGFDPGDLPVTLTLGPTVRLAAQIGRSQAPAMEMNA